MNGKTVEVDNTDAEGRLVLSVRLSSCFATNLVDSFGLQDAIYYVSSEYKPHTLIDVATLTGYVPQLDQTYSEFTCSCAQRHDDRSRRSILGRFLSTHTFTSQF